MNDSSIVDTLLTSAQTDSLVSKLTDVQEQICRLNEAYVMAQKQYYLFGGMAIIALLLVIFFFRHRLSVVKQTQYKFRDDMQRKIEMLTGRIGSFEKASAPVEQVASKATTDKQCVNEATPTAHNTASEFQPTKTVLTSESDVYRPIEPMGELRVKYGSIQAPDSEGVLRIVDRSLSDTSSTSKWFVISYQEGSSAGSYTMNSDAASEILQDLQTFQLFVEPFTLSGSVLPMSISVVHEGTLQRMERGWVVKKRLAVKFN